jgi:hypothetical protein
MSNLPHTNIRVILNDFTAAQLMENCISITNQKDRVRDIMFLYEKCVNNTRTLEFENQRLRDELTSLRAVIANANIAAERDAFANLAKKHNSSHR